MVIVAIKLKDTPWKKSYDQPRQHIKNRDITWPTKVHLIKALVFPEIIYGCESWTIKKAEIVYCIGLYLSRLLHSV